MRTTKVISTNAEKKKWEFQLNFDMMSRTDEVIDNLSIKTTIPFVWFMFQMNYMKLFTLGFSPQLPQDIFTE